MCSFPLQEDTREASSSSDPQSMDRLVDLLNSMRSNSSGVEQQLVSFMEEAQCSARSEETLAQVVDTIYSKAVSDRSFAATAAKLCDKMALFIVDGTKFRSLLLNMLQVRAQGHNSCFYLTATNQTTLNTRVLPWPDTFTFPKPFLHSFLFCKLTDNN